MSVYVGCKLYYINKHARREDKAKICMTEITAIGRKYYTVGRDTQVHIENLREKSDFSPVQYYFSRTALEDVLWIEENRSSIWDDVRRCDDITKLREIKAILEPGE